FPDESARVAVCQECQASRLVAATRWTVPLSRKNKQIGPFHLWIMLFVQCSLQQCQGSSQAVPSRKEPAINDLGSQSYSEFHLTTCCKRYVNYLNSSAFYFAYDCNPQQQTHFYPRKF